MPDNRNYYVICEDKCLFPSMTAEQILAAIAEATGNVPTSVDDAFITKVKSSGQQKNINFWYGTEAEYNAISPAPSVDRIIMRVDANGKVYLCKDDSYAAGLASVALTSQEISTIFANESGGSTGKYLDPNGLATLSSLIKSADAKVFEGSYTGLGVYGSSNPTTLTFDFAPKLVVFLSRSGSPIIDVSGASNATWGKIIPSMLTTSFQANKPPYWQAIPSNAYAKKSADGKTLYWYNTSAGTQLNEAVEYHYIAIG